MDLNRAWELRWLSHSPSLSLARTLSACLCSTGGLHNFQEVWPDEGDVNMFKLAQTLHSVGYEYMLMPDHAPGACGRKRHLFTLSVFLSS